MKEIILTVEEFEKIVNHIKKLEKANKALNAQIRKYNKYAKGINDGSK